MAVNKKNKFNLSLHEEDYNISQAEDGFIFKSIVNTTNMHELEISAFRSIWNICREDTDEDPEWYSASMIHINLYFTKVTSALIAVLNVCRREGITVTLWHFDTIDKIYYPVDILGCMKYTKSLSTHTQTIQLKTAILSSIQITMYEKHGLIIR